MRLANLSGPQGRGHDMAVGVSAFQTFRSGSEER